MKEMRQGLTPEEVLASRQQHGENVLTPPKRQSMWRLYIEKYQDPMIRILLVAAVVSLVLAFVKQDFMETVGIIAAIILATTVGFYFERDAARRFNLLNQIGEEQPVKVVRRRSEAGGLKEEVIEIPRREVVVGDIVIVETGDEVPADGQLIEATDLQVDESSLTGEMLTAKEVRWKKDDGRRKTEEGRGKTEDGSGEAYPKDMVLRSSMVMNGTGRFVVTAVGDMTEIGHVARQATELTGVKTPLNIQLTKLAKLISTVGGSLAMTAFAVFLIHDIMTDELWLSNDYLGMVGVVLKYFMMAVTLIVMAVPEGLPMAVTLALALNMRRMLKSNDLVRKLQASETMGAVTVICTDKTGTLTENRMTVVDVRWMMDDGRRKMEEGRGKMDDGRGMMDDGRWMTEEGRCSDLSPQPSDLYKAIALNTTATHDVGNPTEQALLRWLVAQGVDYEQLRRENPITAREPFSTERKYMSTTVGDTIYIKGAPEVVMEMLDGRGMMDDGRGMMDDGRGMMDDGRWKKEEGGGKMDDGRGMMEETLKEWQRHAMRTLAIASYRVQGHVTCDDTHQSPVTLAIVAISDPIRQEVPAAIRQCRMAGIDVKIVTGDTSETALEIARQCGLMDHGDGSPTVSDRGQGHVTCDDTHQSPVTITGAEFAALSDEEALEMITDLKVMSRARPSDKQRLVQLLQAKGEVVAVTGDGTNDAPALNRAHVGLSLGSGTSVAKQASDITLIDDSFRSIVYAVMWGRSLYRNIQRFIFFQLIVNVTALLLVLFGAFIGTEMPLTIIQILWVNLIMDTFAAGALASLPPSKEVLREKPRSKDAFIISRQMLRGIVMIGGLFFVCTAALLWHFESSENVSPHELTIFFTIFVMMQWWNLFNARSLGSSFSAFHNIKGCGGFVLVLALVLVGQWMIVTFGGEMFRTEALTWQEWLWIIAGTSPVLIVGEVYRKLKSLRSLRV